MRTVFGRRGTDGLNRKGVLLAALLAVLSPSIAGGSGSAPVPKPPVRWILVYAASVKGGIGVRYSSDDFVRLLAAVDTTGKPVRWLCTGAILLHPWAPSGRAFASWIGGSAADGRDWKEYVDSLAEPGGVLARLDSTVARLSMALGPLRDTFPVVVMVPYPTPRDSIRFEGHLYQLDTDSGRIAGVEAFVNYTKQRFHDARFRNLRLDGFYWLSESVKDIDTATVSGVAKRVHAAGVRFLWVPYYFANNQRNWKQLGFDEAWLQPNYFFHPEVPAARMDSAADKAVSLGLGLEIEFNSRMFADTLFRDRLTPYLSALETRHALGKRSIAIFDGEGALIQLSKATDARSRALYNRLIKVLSAADAR